MSANIAAGAAMSFPPSPVIADIFMEHFEKKALNPMHLKSKLWKIYKNDTLII